MKRFAVLSACAAASVYADVNKPYLQGIENKGMVTPSSRFEVEDGYNIFFTGDFLWWKAREDGLLYAQSGYIGTSAVLGNANFSGSLSRILPSWRPGFRVGLGGNLPYDGWDIALNWTRYNSRIANQRDDAAMVWAFPDRTPISTDASANWRLRLNLIDFELGKDLWIGQKLSFRPFAGARWAWINQRMNVFYAFSPGATFQDLSIYNVCNFGGGGIRAGFNLRYMVSRQWSIQAMNALSGLYGWFKTSFQETEGAATIGTSTDNFYQGILSYQIALGIRWDVYFWHNSRYHIGVFGGWEQNFWIGVNQFSHFRGQLAQGIMTKENGNLSLQGGTLTARFDF